MKITGVHWIVDAYGQNVLVSGTRKYLTIVIKLKDKYRIKHDSLGCTNESYDTLRDAQDAAELFWGAN